MRISIEVFRDEIRVRYSLEDLLRVIREILGRGGAKCIPRRSELSDEDRILVKALSILGCRYVYLCKRSGEEFYSLEEMGFYEDISPEPLRVFNNTEELIYRNWPTPLVKLRSLSREGVSLWAKLEYYNPYSMSIKDRIAWYMIKNLVEEFSLEDREKVLYEATSTNTGMGLAAVGALHGFSAKLYIPSTIQRASDTILAVMGAEVHRVPKRLTVEFVDDVDRIAREARGVHLNQFVNDYNFFAHLRYTAKELDLQIRHGGLRLRGVIASLGTSGHFSALSLYYKSRYGEHIKMYAVQPAPEEVIPGTRRIETGMKWIHLVSYDRVIDVRLEEAIREAIQVARSEGLFIGLSSGAVVAGFKKLLEEGALEKGDYVAVFPDHGFKYIEQYSKYLEKRT